MIKKYLSFLLTTTFIGIFLVYIILYPENFEGLKNLELHYLILIGLFQLGFIFANGLFIKYALELFDKKLSQKESFFVSLLSTIGNYFTPFRGGAGIRAVYLKKKFDFSYSNFVATLSGYYIITFFLNSLIALASLMTLYLQNEEISIPILSFLLVVFLFTLALIIFSPPVKLISQFKINNRFLRQIQTVTVKVLEGWHIIIKDKIVLLKLIGVTGANFFVVMIITFIATQGLNIDIGITSLFFYVALGNMTLLMSITPGSIGIKESFYLYTSGIIGLSKESILQIAVIDRGTLFFVLGLSYILIKVFDLNILKKRNES